MRHARLPKPGRGLGATWGHYHGMRCNIGIGSWQRGLQPMLLFSTGGQRHGTTRESRRRGSRAPRTNRRRGADRPAAMGSGGCHRPGNRSVRRFPHMGATSHPAPEGEGRRGVPRTRRHVRNLQITTPHQPPFAHRCYMVHEPGTGAPRALHLASIPPLRNHTGTSPDSPQGNQRAQAPGPNPRDERGGLGPT